MPVEFIQKDGKGRVYTSDITKDGEDLVIASPYPPLLPQKVRPFRQYMTIDGTKEGSNDLGVDGSVTNVEFCVPAVEEYDRYITTLNILVGYGTTGKPYLFADSTPLVNGCRLFYNSYRGEVDVHDGLKNNEDFFRLASYSMPTSWEVRHLNANNDFGYTVFMDLTKLGLPFGIKLDKDTKQKLALTIRDNATNADSFNIIAVGFERFE